MNFDFSALYEQMTRGGPLVSALDIVLSFPPEELSNSSIIATYLNFGSHGILLEAVEKDALQVTEIDSISEWVERRTQCYVNETFGEEEFYLKEVTSKSISRHVGTLLTDYWACTDEVGVVDAIDLAFHDLLHPTDKILCISSSLTFLLISQVDAES